MIEQHGVRFAKYGISGGVAFVFEYITFVACYYVLQFPLIGANTASFLVALGISFGLNRQWVFQPGKRAGRQFALFTGLAIINYLLTLTALTVTKSHAIEPAYTKITMMAVITLWNYVLMHQIIFVEE